MPQHVQPILRSLEKAVEGLGFIQALDSVGYTVTEAQEDAGTRPPAQLPLFFFWFQGQQITPTD